MLHLVDNKLDLYLIQRFYSECCLIFKEGAVAIIDNNTFCLYKFRYSQWTTEYSIEGDYTQSKMASRAIFYLAGCYDCVRVYLANESIRRLCNIVFKNATVVDGSMSSVGSVNSVSEFADNFGLFYPLWKVKLPIDGIVNLKMSIKEAARRDLHPWDVMSIEKKKFIAYMRSREAELSLKARYNIWLDIIEEIV